MVEWNIKPAFSKPVLQITDCQVISILTEYITTLAVFLWSKLKSETINRCIISGLKVTRLSNSPVGQVCKIYRLHLCREIRPLPNKYPVYNIKKFLGEAAALEIWGMQNTPRSSFARSVSTWEGPIYRLNWYDRHLKWVQANNLCWIELFEINLSDHLTVYKEISNV